MQNTIADLADVVKVLVPFERLRQIAGITVALRIHVAGSHPEVLVRQHLRLLDGFDRWRHVENRRQIGDGRPVSRRGLRLLSLVAVVVDVFRLRLRQRVELAGSDGRR